MEDVSIQTRAARQDVPPYSQEAFMEYLVRFIVADDQVTATVLYFIYIPHSNYICLVDSCCRVP